MISAAGEHRHGLSAVEQQVAQVLRGVPRCRQCPLGSPARLHLLDLLIQAERSVEELAAAAAMPVGNTSAQVRALHAAGLVTSSPAHPPVRRAAA